MAEPKNPHRQLGQYRRMIEVQRRVLRYAPLFWAVPASLLVVAVARDWHWVLVTILSIGVFGGAVAHFNEWGRLKDYKLKQARIEEST
jgi:hypothetical protein